MLTPGPILFGPVFLHYFDIHFLAERGFTHVDKNVLDELRLATRLAIACADRVYLPAASFVESEICRVVLEEFRDLYHAGVIELVGSAANMREFSEEKLDSYRTGSPLYKRYREANTLVDTPAFQRKSSRTTKDVGAYWTESGQSNETFPKLFHGTKLIVPKGFEKTWIELPERLEKLAFVLEHVQEQLGQLSHHRVLAHRLHGVINQGYFASYTQELNATVVTDLVYLGDSYEIPVSHDPLPFRTLVQTLHRQAPQLLEYVKSTSPVGLLKLKDDPDWLGAVSAARIAYTGRLRRIAERQVQKAQPPKPVAVYGATGMKHQPIKNIVVLIHGIQTFAPWQERVAAKLHKLPNVQAHPIGYDFFDVFKFWFPLFTRRFPINKVLREIRNIRADNPNDKITVVAHSFGTYIVTEILMTESDVRLHRLLLCGSVVSTRYRWDLVPKRPEIVLNDVGVRDYLPLLATALSWGYGASGTFGFKTVTVTDRFNDCGHSGFFDDPHVDEYWIPFIASGNIVASPTEAKRQKPSRWMSVFSIFPVKTLIAVMLYFTLIR